MSETGDTERAIREALTVLDDGERHEPAAEYVQVIAAALVPVVAAEVAAAEKRVRDELVIDLTQRAERSVLSRGFRNGLYTAARIAGGGCRDH